MVKMRSSSLNSLYLLSFVPAIDKLLIFRQYEDVLTKTFLLAQTLIYSFSFAFTLFFIFVQIIAVVTGPGLHMLVYGALALWVIPLMTAILLAPIYALITKKNNSSRFLIILGLTSLIFTLYKLLPTLHALTWIYTYKTTF